jgi:hypothetical protein
LHLVRFLGRPEPDEESDEDQQMKTRPLIVSAVSPWAW